MCSREYLEFGCAKADLALRSNPVSKGMVLKRLVTDLTAERPIEEPGWMQEQLPV